jgi:RNA polymerase sigma-70 factor (ECF subfamily)
VARSSPYADCSDEELLALFRQGTREAFGAMVRRYEGELYGYLRRYLGDRDLADDVFQNTFLQVYTKIHHYESGRPVRPWLYAIATNQAIDALRRQGRHQTVRLHAEGDADDADTPQLLALLESRGPGPLEQVQDEERKQLIRGSVERLPDFLKQVVILAYYQGLKYKDVADILGIPVGTVKSRLHTALGKLQEAWAAEPALKE